MSKRRKKGSQNPAATRIQYSSLRSTCLLITTSVLELTHFYFLSFTLWYKEVDSTSSFMHQIVHSAYTLKAETVEKSKC